MKLISIPSFNSIYSFKIKADVCSSELQACALLVFSTTPVVDRGARRRQIERLWCCCLCGRLKQGGGDSSGAPWGHLWNRLTNVSLLCHKDTRLTKPAINAPFTTHLFVTQVFIPAVSCTVLPWLTRPGAISSHVLQGGQSMRDRSGQFLLNFDGLSLLLLPLLLPSPLPSLVWAGETSDM